MKTWTQAELDALIACDKRTLEPPKKSMRLELGNYRNEATLRSLDGQHSFRVFIRQNAKFSENYKCVEGAARPLPSVGGAARP